MKKQLLSAALASTVLMFAAAAQAECVVHYTRTACKGQEAVSFKKCDGNASCDKTKEAADAAACAAAALKSCANDRLDITKYKEITADFDGTPLVGGFDNTGNPDPAGPNFCAADRPDLNQCE